MAYKASFEEVQRAFVEERITLQQFISILIDNFGMKKTYKIIEKNLAKAIENNIDLNSPKKPK